MDEVKPFDLLSTVEYGGCSAKLSARELSEALAGLPKTPHKNLLVDIETHDDAGVYKITDELALIQTTDFFSPVCSDPYEFGQIAAANALSDVYAMGGEVLTALNIVAFPAGVDLKILKQIIWGGTDKVIEAGGVIVGGHTIVDDVPKFGLAVTGSIHPNRVITNAAAKPGDVLILTKPVGAGVVIAGKRLGEVSDINYQVVLDSMKQLNRKGAQVMQKYNVKCATDVTGFSLLGHALKMAMGSNVSMNIESTKVPFFNGAMDLVELGCIPGACFRNQEFVEENTEFQETLGYNYRMLLLDAQTSGGLLICCQQQNVNDMLTDLKNEGFPRSAVVGSVTNYNGKNLQVS
ncbi:MAG TPA: selenide, water dikinase SelD [Tenuifilaceae bacterium]|nr:selenide, water dikinase SelD [Tenuifilaceae bacterium]HPE18505.1 selenide, water dikinase SelD [Tenuifilaceae bacterium]HPJ46187.1 selenide, water dikinase SelD [Tenuifilaceae bacterium]HPQ34782.1 selenide, water dikinase SelD [Tenuifilaceae bacterium]HRX68138.1 selenide, water dikinase SelD [Tenuifilaceae bacterium]